jgi:hypothetical protein
VAYSAFGDLKLSQPNFESDLVVDLSRPSGGTVPSVKLRSYCFIDRLDGSNVYIIDVVADRLELCRIDLKEPALPLSRRAPYTCNLPAPEWLVPSQRHPSGQRCICHLAVLFVNRMAPRVGSTLIGIKSEQSSRGRQAGRASAIVSC